MLYTLFLLVSVFLMTFTFSTGGGGSGIYKIYYPILFLSIAVTFFFAENKRIYKSSLYLLVVYIALSVVALLSELNFDIVFIFTWLMLCGFFLSCVILNNKEKSVLSLKLFLFINLLFICFQFVYTVTFPEGIYIHGFLFPFSRDAYSLVELGGFYRMSGYHLEPGSYATMIIITLFVYTHVTKGEHGALLHASALSVLLTFSVIGFILFALFYINFLKNYVNIKKSFIFLSLFMLLLFVLAENLELFTYLEERFSMGANADSSSGVKISNLLYFYNNYDISAFVYGFGVSPDFSECNSCGHIQSNGVLFNLFFLTGFFTTFLILFLLYKRQVFKKMPYFLVCFFIMRYGYVFPVFWFVLSYLFLAEDFTDEKD